MRILQLDHAPRCVSYSADGTLLAVGGLDGVSLFSLPAAELTDLLDVEGQGVEALAFSPNGELLAAGCEREIIFWNVKERKELARVQGHRGGTTALAWSPHEISGVVTTGWDRQFFWNVRFNTALTLQTAEPVAALIAQPHGRLLAGGGWRCLFFWEWNPKRKMWDPLPSIDVGMPIRALAVSPDGKLLVAGYGDGRLSLWDLDERKWIGEMAGHEWVVYGLGFTPDGRRIVSGSADGTVRLWDVPNRHQIATYRFHKSWVTCVAVAPDGMTAACGGDDATLVLWDLADA